MAGGLARVQDWVYFRMVRASSDCWDTIVSDGLLDVLMFGNYIVLEKSRKPWYRFSITIPLLAGNDREVMVMSPWDGCHRLIVDRKAV